MPDCTDCGRVFISAGALHAHCRDNDDHAYCEDCERLFGSAEALDEHLWNSSAHRIFEHDSSEEQVSGDKFECTQCRQKFVFAKALHAHCRDADDHAYCEDCKRTFGSFRSLNNHLHLSPSHSGNGNYENEFEPYCDSCDLWFVNNAKLRQHFAKSSMHNCLGVGGGTPINRRSPLKRSSSHQRCPVCSRKFKSENALNQHQVAKQHNPASIFCPLCNKGFRAPSSIALHIESGVCHEKIDRHRVTAAVHSLDINPAISISQRIEGPPPVVTYTATELAYNGTAYECYLCHRTFHALYSLDAHLCSAAHDADEFKCPAKTCGSEFKLISGLIQHIESESCGLARFKEVEEYAADLTSRFSRLLRV